MNSREAILQDIRQAIVTAHTQDIPGQYRVDSDLNGAERIARFVSRLSDYGVTILHADPEAGIAPLAAKRLAETGIHTLLVPPDLPAAWRPDAVSVIEDAGQSAHELAALDGVMTGCAVAIAETGTIVLDAGPRQGRRAITLLPDYYLCVVFADQIVGIVPEAAAQLAGAAQAGRPLTFISGPSATADIELKRVAGVHGPRRLDVILVR